MNQAKTIKLHSSSNESIDSVALALALKIKGVEFTLSPNANSSEPMLEVGADTITGFVTILDFIEGCSQTPSLFPNGNKGMPIALKYWSQQFLDDGRDGMQTNSHLSLISRQLDDGRNFLQGAEAGLADVFSFSPIFILCQEPDNIMAEEIAKQPLLAKWCERMEAISS